jgi:hypothetical protein
MVAWRLESGSSKPASCNMMLAAMRSHTRTRFKA